MTIYIGFTGHRDSHADELDLWNIHDQYPNALWIHGGARGFDRQVEQFAKRYGHPTVIFRPDYIHDVPKIAPLIRDERIVDRSDFLVACYDGRETGGTYYTINYAKRVGKEVYYVTCKKGEYDDFAKIQW